MPLQKKQIEIQNMKNVSPREPLDCCLDENEMLLNILLLIHNYDCSFVNKNQIFKTIKLY